MSTGGTHATHTYVAKNWTGLTLWTAYTSGWFTSNGWSVSAVHDDSYIKRGTLSVWSITNLDKDDKSINSQLAEVYVSGNVSWGYYIGGVGLTVQDMHIKLLKFRTLKNQCFSG